MIRRVFTVVLISCFIVTLLVCVMGIFLRMPYWRLSPNTSPDFSMTFIRLMYPAIGAIILGMVAVIGRFISSMHNRKEWLRTIGYAIAFVFCVIVYTLIYSPSELSGFYEVGYCSNAQKLLYSNIQKYIQTHDGKMPSSLEEIHSSSPLIMGCYTRTTSLPIPPEYKPFAMNDFIAGKVFADIPNNDHVVLLAESISIKNMYSADDIDWEGHRLGSVIMFCDGRVEIFIKRPDKLIFNPWH